MDVTAVCRLVREVAGVRAATATDRTQLEGAVRAITQVRSWLAAAEADLVARLAKVASFPEQSIAGASRGSQGEATTALERSATLGAAPALASALDDGAVTPGHVDVVTKVAKGLEGQQRDQLLARADELVGVAATSTTPEFRRRLEQEARRLRNDDGSTRFERQQRAARVRRWTDADGMWCIMGRFDPLTGLRLNARLNAEVEARFATSVPEGCPSDPLAKHEFLAARAFAGIFDGDDVAQRAGRPEFIVVIEADAPAEAPADVASAPAAEAAAEAEGAGDTGRGGSDGHGGPRASTSQRGDPLRVDWGLPVELPRRVLADLFGSSDVHAVVVRNGVVLSAPGQLDLGRSTRLANRPQRRALRALYARCAIPGCTVRFDHCKIHHVQWWRHGGRTDLCNLLPLCVRHHTKVHAAGWVITLSANRQLTITYPDGAVQATGPPSRRAA